MRNTNESIIDINVSSELVFKKNVKVHYGTATIMSNGYFHLKGNIEMEIDCLIIKKQPQNIKYDFLITSDAGVPGAMGEDGGDAETADNVKIIIHELRNTAHIKALGGAGGTGGQGYPGRQGGNGADAVSIDTAGGKGGGGSNGGTGFAGGQGADGPNVYVEYAPCNENTFITALTLDDVENNRNIAYGGMGGAGGTGGDGGDGGNGGRNGDGSYAASGKPGKKGKMGKKGKKGKNKKMKFIALQ